MERDTRERILEAAIELYLEQGRRGVTMRAVAARVGLTATALYRHFDHKEALLSEVVAHGFRVFGSYLYRSLEGADPVERLRLSGRAYLDFGLEKPEIYRTIFMSDRADQAADGDEDPRTSATFRFLADRVTECVEAGVLRPGPPDELALTIWAHTHGLLALFIAGAIRLEEEAFRSVFERSVGRLFEGLTSRGHPYSTTCPKSPGAA